MEKSKTAPVLDKKVKELHEELIEALGDRPLQDDEVEPYWDTSSTTFQMDFKARVDKLLKTYADQPVPPGGASQAAATKASG